MRARSLMIQGTASSVGKSLVTAALCRIFRRQGFSVAPFKAQNMSLNSFITPEGHEIGRAQAVQAEAAGIEPSSLMNPVLLKPCAEHVSQVIVRGLVRCTLSAREYHGFRAGLREEVRAAYEELARAHDLILIEGAGSPAEINLRENDLANMGMAAMADAPVLLLGDIERGGVFAALYGTVRLLEQEERRRIRLLAINKFRGDPGILEPGLRQLEGLLGIPFAGVLPYADIRIDEEDSLSERLGAARGAFCEAGELDIAVIRLPRMSNYTDFTVFELFPDVRLRYVQRACELGRPDLLVLPGSKSTLADLAWLRRGGLAAAILGLAAEGVALIGICGGFQMLGKGIRDPHGVEDGGEARGLGLLDLETVFEAEKRTRRVCLRLGKHGGLLAGSEGMELCGYEIHMGRSEDGLRREGGEGNACAPLGRTGQNGAGRDGLVHPSGRILGSYVHGFFDHVPFTRLLLNNLRREKGLAPLAPPPMSHRDFRLNELDRLADLVEGHMDLDALKSCIEQWPGNG
ncbi:cobyric acid synthase [Desulfovibrio sp. OttesenSCG-928-A18]|nr:cobyric acid synthase [Desulfovibrio sp. OttesenSCG-928-A18]